jgi:hypothetical protein
LTPGDIPIKYLTIAGSSQNSAIGAEGQGVDSKQGAPPLPAGYLVF